MMFIVRVVVHAHAYTIIIEDSKIYNICVQYYHVIHAN